MCIAALKNAFFLSDISDGELGTVQMSHSGQTAMCVCADEKWHPRPLPPELTRLSPLSFSLLRSVDRSDLVLPLHVFVELEDL